MHLEWVNFRLYKLHLNEIAFKKIIYLLKEQVVSSERKPDTKTVEQCCPVELSAVLEMICICIL